MQLDSQTESRFLTGLGARFGMTKGGARPDSLGKLGTGSSLRKERWFGMTKVGMTVAKERRSA